MAGSYSAINPLTLKFHKLQDCLVTLSKHFAFSFKKLIIIINTILMHRLLDVGGWIWHGEYQVLFKDLGQWY